MIDYSKVQIAEDQICYYSPYRVLIFETNEMNAIADKKQRAKGEMTYFDDTNPDNDDKGWYNFYFDTNGKEVIQFYYEYMDGSYCDSIEMTDEEKMDCGLCIPGGGCRGRFHRDKERIRSQKGSAPAGGRGEKGFCRF